MLLNSSFLFPIFLSFYSFLSFLCNSFFLFSYFSLSFFLSVCLCFSTNRLLSCKSYEVSTANMQLSPRNVAVQIHLIIFKMNHQFMNATHIFQSINKVNQADVYILFFS